MATHVIPRPLTTAHPHTMNVLGLWSAAVTALLSAAAFLIAITTAPPRSGPFCLDACIVYPYTDAVAFVPNDYLWMYPAILIAPALMLLVAAIHHEATADRKLFALIALSFAIASTAIHVTNYFIQLTVMQPSLLKGELEGLTLLSQYNPHGLFIALEDIGYLLMSATLLFVALAFSGHGLMARAIKWIFAISFGLVVVALGSLALRFGVDLEYRFEVAVIVIDWTALIIGGVLLSLFFWRDRPRPNV